MQKINKQQVQTLKGFRDFLPAEKRKRDFITEKVIETFENFGFEPLETPTLEYASLLLGKYGEEADKLVYNFEDRGGRKIGLRYDQTVPTARVLAQYRGQLAPAFRRYQIQNVFRAEKPQKGRYREFTQCDCDIFASPSPIADAEILAVYYAVFKNIGFKNIIIEVNNRKDIFDTLSTYPLFNKEGKTSPQIWEKQIKTISKFLQSIDKLDKLSETKVIEELTEKEFQKDQVIEILNTLKTAEEKQIISQELKPIIDYAVNLGVPRKNLKYNPFMVRGLDYYTGLIFEGKIPEYTVGSVGGGGRYDNLIKELSGVKISAVGFGIGFDRTVEAADQLSLIPDEKTSVKVLVTTYFNTEESLTVATKLRQSGINTEVYPSAIGHLKAQFKLADRKSIPWVVIIGEEEVEKNLISLKNMQTGEQEQVSIEEACATIKRI